MDKIIELVSNCDWLIHNFKTDDSLKIYNPANYLHNAEVDRITYTAVLDLNIFQFLVNCAKKQYAHERYREAAAFLVFCQIAEIKVDPTYAVYERINYDGANLDEALSDLELFRNIDSGSTDDLVAYALGYSSTLQPDDGIQIDRQELETKLLMHQRLTEWDSLYLIVLVIIDTHYDSSIPKKEKLSTFIDRLITEFRLSLPAVMYSVRLFGKHPLKRMMKFRTSDLGHQKRTAVFNMTWDLYLMNCFFRLWTSKTDKEETFFVSDDNALRSVMRLAVDVQQQNSLLPVQALVDARTWSIVKELLDNYQSRTDRAYQSECWRPEHRADLIDELEKKLFS